MKFSEYLSVVTESFKTLSSPEEKEIIGQDVYDMIVKAYEPIGGSTFKSVQELIDGSGMWKIDRIDGKISTVVIYKNTKVGRKIVAIATDKSKRSIKKLIEIVTADLMIRDGYSEISGPLEKFMFKMIPNLSEYVVKDKDEIEKILGKGKTVEMSDDGIHYTRYIGGLGHAHEKIMIKYI